MKITIFVLTIVVQLLSNAALAKDFGKQGATFEIKEEGFISMMQRKLKELNLAEYEQKMKDLARKRVEEPTPVLGITRATKTVSRSFDPSYVLDEDVFLPCGKLLYAKGMTVNPLDQMSWDGTLVFIDGRDKEQVTWAVENYTKPMTIARDEELTQIKQNLVSEDSLNNHDKDVSKIVLVAGPPLELQQEIGAAVYFDQFGELTKKFNIAHVPAVIKQNGKYLKVTEINIEGR